LLEANIENGKEVKGMEVSANMASSLFSQALNGSAPAIETGSPQSGTNASVRFSRLLGLCSGMGEDKQVPTDTSANPMFLKVIATSMQQPVLMQQQEAEMESGHGSEEDPVTTTLPEKDEKTGDRSPVMESHDLGVNPQVTGLPLAQAVEAVNSTIVANTAKPLHNELKIQSSEPEETVNSSITGKVQDGFTGLAGLPRLNRQESLSLPVNYQGENQETVIPAQSATLPLQGGPAAAITKIQSSAMQSGILGKTANGDGRSQNNPVNTISDIPEVSVSIQDPGQPRKAFFSADTSINRQISKGSAANPDLGAAPPGMGLKQAADSTLTQTEGVSGEPGGIPLQTDWAQKAGISTLAIEEPGNPGQGNPIAEAAITGETLKASKDATNAYKASAGEVTGNARIIVSSSAAGIQPAEQATTAKAAVTTQDQDGKARSITPKQDEVNLSVKPGPDIIDPSARQGSKDPDKSIKAKLDVTNPEANSELNSMDPSVKPGLNSSGPGQTQQRVDLALTGEVKSMAKETEGDLTGKGREEKSAVIDTPNILVHGPGETRVNGESRLTAPANDGKLPSAEQIHQQVRDKLESGDYGVNKGSITLKLHPQELGELKINLRMEDQRLKVEIVTENHSVKEALMQNLDTLKETLSRQSITMDRFNVSADVRQGFQQGSRDGSRMMQDNRGVNTPFNTAGPVEESTLPNLHYGWESDNSLVSLVL
jgi:flagellar hook-length control protein FliK